MYLTSIYKVNTKCRNVARNAEEIAGNSGNQWHLSLEEQPEQPQPQPDLPAFASFTFFTITAATAAAITIPMIQSIISLPHFLLIAPVYALYPLCILIICFFGQIVNDFDIDSRFYFIQIDGITLRDKPVIHTRIISTFLPPCILLPHSIGVFPQRHHV